MAVDGVYNRFRDGDGLKAECEQGRDLGFDGKTLIHPAQIEIANTAFAPTRSEIELAERQIAAHEESRPRAGVAVVDGQIVENLHVVAAQRRPCQGRAIAEMERSSKMVYLILGLILWTAAHLFKRVAPEARAAHGQCRQGVVAAACWRGLVLMVYRLPRRRFVNLWFRPPGRCISTTC